MSKAQERVKVLAAQVKQAMKQLKLTEAKVAALSEELLQAAAVVKAEAEAAATIIEYPSGRYECKHCGHGTLFTEAVIELPACDNCGSREYVGHEAKVTKKKAPARKRFLAGMYECASCSTRVVVSENCDTAPACDNCGETKLKPLV